MWNYIHKNRHAFLLGDKYAPVVLIRSGAGGTFNGYSDKYLEIAKALQTEGKYSTISSSNNGIESFQEAITLSKKLARELEADKIFFIGSSLGALQGLQQEAEEPLFSKMILINPPLMVNFHQTTLQAVKQVHSRVNFVFGSMDPSARYIPFLSNVLGKKPNISFTLIPNADHHFSGMLNEFVDICTKFVL